MLHRLILKVTKFQLPPRKRLGTVIKNILGAIMTLMSNGVKGRTRVSASGFSEMTLKLKYGHMQNDCFSFLEIQFAWLPELVSNT